MNSNAEITPDFFNIFGAWFDADLVDLYSQESVDNAIGGSGADLSRRDTDLNDLIARLTGVLEQWGPDKIQPFERATNIDWLASEQTEAILRYIIQGIIKELAFHRDRR
jgi:hypothetical protein